MAENSRTITTSFLGQNFDLHPLDFKDGMYAFALNGVVEGIDGDGFPILQNELSNILGVNFPSGSTVVGALNVIEQNRIIWFLTNPLTGASEIGETQNPGETCRRFVDEGYVSCDDCQSVRVFESSPLETIAQSGCSTYTTIQADPCFNFSNKFPINAIQYRLTPCSIQIFWTDNNENRRWLEFYYTNNDPTQSLYIRNIFYEIIGYGEPPCSDPIYGPNLSCNAINVQPSFAPPCIEFLGLTGGGSNLAGTYEFFVCMSDVKGNKLTSFLSGTNPIPIFTKTITTNTNYLTDRSIMLDIQGLVPSGTTQAYEYYNLAVAKVIDNVVSFSLVGTFPVTQEFYTYTGNNAANETKLSENDIFDIYIFYTTARALGQSNGLLYWGNLAENVKPNLQQVANGVGIQWQTIAIPESIYNNPVVFQKYRGYMRDEVYALAMEFVFDNGEESNAYHIPGRASISSDLIPVNNNDAIQESNCVDCSGNTGPVAQITISSPNLTTCPCASGDTPVLNPNNANQSPSCDLIPFSATGCTNHYSGSGTTPVVNAGSNQTITVVSPVPLNGTAQAFPPALIVSTMWYQLSGPNEVSIANPGSLNTTFSDINPGTYQFQLCVTDSYGNINTSTVQYFVNVPVNTPPVSNPGGDQIVELPANSAYLDGSQSSGTTSSISTYNWYQLSGPNTAAIANPTLAFTQVTNLIQGTYHFELVVVDTRGCASSGTTFVYVLADPCNEIPCCAQLLHPANGSVTNSPNFASLQWQDVQCATSYAVYLAISGDSYVLQGTTSNPYWTLDSLIPNTIYNWYIVPSNAIGNATGCTACYFSFVTQVAPPGNTCVRETWQVYNTATIEGGSLDIYDGCTESCYQYGNMAYWQSTETYPNNPLIWGDLCGQPIRHHKMPDSVVTHIHDSMFGTPNYAQSNLIFVLGIKVDHDSVVASIDNAVDGGFITQADADRIIGYRIVRANRSGNKSIVAKGLLYDVNYYQRVNGSTDFDQAPVYFANYPFNDLNANPFVTDNFQNYDQHNTPVGPNLPFIPTNRYTFHSPDTHFNNPSVGTILKLETAEYGQAQGYYSVAQKQARQRFLSNASYDIAFCAGVMAAILSFYPPTPTTYTVKGSVVSALGVAAGEWGPYLPALAGAGAGAVGGIFANTPTNIGADAVMSPATEINTTIQGGKMFDYLNPVWMAYNIPYLLPLYPLIAANILFQLLTTALNEANVIIDLITSLSHYKDWCVQYQAVGKYNSYAPVYNGLGNKIREIDSWSYLDSNNQYIDEDSQLNPMTSAPIPFNNWNRESSLYLRYLGSMFPNAGTTSGIEDNSRQTLGSGLFNCTLNQNQFTDISSYYASIKNYVPDQYGTIYNPQYIPTDSCMFELGTSNSICRGVYGGDTFINRFALKTKVPYFLSTTFQLPDGTDFGYDLYPNLGVPRYYYDSTEGIGDGFNGLSFSLFTNGAADLLGRPKSIRDCSKDSFFNQNGYIYLYHYGIPYFLVESDYNVNYRYATDNLSGDFYPDTQDLNFWLQEINVPIAQDNTYNYNNSYSKQNEETSIGIDQPDFIPGRECDVQYPGRIIYSDDTDWLVYPPDNFYDYPISKGPIVGIDGIENQTVLVRDENSTSVFKSILRLPVEGQTTQVGNGSIFSNPPQDFGETTLGYVGSQHAAIVHTEYGHVWVDAKRGQVFNMGQGGGGLDEISKYGFKNWFKENLPFRLLRTFQNMPETDIDNAYLGAGIAIAFDKRFGRVLITKKDYLCINSAVQYNATTKEFFIGDAIINLGDPKYFKDCSWTMSFNFWTKMWTSFHSYKPNYYIDFIDFFGSGQNNQIGGQSTWNPHGLYNGSYQVFNGKLWPFIVEPVMKFEQELKALNSVEFDTEVKRYANEFDYSIRREIPGFNKAIVYNDFYNSGLLELVKKNKNSFAQVGKFPKKNFNSWTIQVSSANYKWRFNDIFALNKPDSDVPFFLYSGNNAEKSVNPSALNYQKNDYNLYGVKGQWFKTRLINDDKSNYKIVFKLSIDNQTTLLR